MMLVYLVRHAHSLANARQDEGLNSGLSPLGLLQVEAVARRLIGTQFTAVYSSPFRRCLETAGPIAKHFGLPVRLRPELCEFHALPPGTPGSTGVAAAAELATQHSGVVPCPDCDKMMTWPAVDELREAMIARTQAFVAFLKDRWRGEDDRILVIGHGSPTARLIEAWLTDRPGPSFRFVIDNATLNLLRYRNGVSSLLQLNDTSHLTGLIAAESPFGLTSDSLKTNDSEW